MPASMNVLSKPASQVIFCSQRHVEVLSYKVSLSNNESAPSCIICRSELSRILRMGKILWPPGHSIMCTWLSPFPGQRLVASPEVAISV